MEPRHLLAELRRRLAELVHDDESEETPPEPSTDED
ncbi:hypothetical protein BJ975_000555 [Aeromicrobium tamlense]|uniref:Uncharacterized protein n=1 Tax=Aeromicrobium tamlense TaxID=375541 RepID=A0ABX2SH74_9ACTN|nr:hypothetical protein [Aeromicrobium tamlense]